MSSMQFVELCPRVSDSVLDARGDRDGGMGVYSLREYWVLMVSVIEYMQNLVVSANSHYVLTECYEYQA